LGSDESHNEVSEDGISRRRMLRRIGAGAAVAWSAPVLTSIRAPAFAATPPPPPPECDACTECPDRAACAKNDSCQCWMKSTDQDPGGCVCGNFVEFCPDAVPCPTGQVECARNAPGTTCVETCCGRICVADCGGGQSKRKSKGGAKTTR
jgi:hypothetical protein